MTDNFAGDRCFHRLDDFIMASSIVITSHMLYSVSDFPYLWTVSLDACEVHRYTFESHSICSDNYLFNTQKYLGVSFIKLESCQVVTG